MSKRAAEIRQVNCTYCEGINEVPQRAMSVFCEHCRKRLILETFKITSYYAVREFFTCGDIVVEKRGHVVAPVKAANITVKGKLQGQVAVREHARITKTGSFKGELEAPVLRVETGAVLDGLLRIGARRNEREPSA